jgi:hypothetical protein
MFLCLYKRHNIIFGSYGINSSNYEIELFKITGKCQDYAQRSVLILDPMIPVV